MVGDIYMALVWDGGLELEKEGQPTAGHDTTTTVYFLESEECDGRIRTSNAHQQWRQILCIFASMGRYTSPCVSVSIPTSRLSLKKEGPE